MNAETDVFNVKIPAGVNLNTLHNPFRINKKRGDDANAYILGLLAYKSEQSRIPADSYHQLQRKILKQLFRSDYKNYLKVLIANGHVKEYSNPYSYKANGITYSCKGTYKIGVSTKKYALNYKKPIFVNYEITDKILIAKIKNARIEQTQRTIENNPTARKIYDSIKLLSIDDKKAKEYLYEYYNKNLIEEYITYLHNRIGIDQTNIFLQEIQQTSVKRKLQSIFKKYGFENSQYQVIKNVFKNHRSLQYRLHQIEIIKRIEAGEHHLISMTSDVRTGRLFHTLTMTPKNLKPFMKLDREQMIELDASNCQWWLFQKLGHILISKGFFNLIKNKSKNIEEPTTNTDINNKHYNIDRHSIHQYIQTLPYTYMCPTFFNKYEIELKKELSKLDGLLYHNEFRNVFVEEFAKQDRIVSESKVKMLLLKHILFSNPSEPYHKDLKIVKEFNSLFPYLSKLIRVLKLDILNEHELRPKPDKNNKSVKWKSLAILLQKMEADIFVKDMASCSGDFITIHDAIITNDSNLHLIQNSLTGALKKRDLRMKLNLNRI